jgi:hypothetical protein
MQSKQAAVVVDVGLMDSGGGEQKTSVNTHM